MKAFTYIEKGEFAFVETSKTYHQGCQGCYSESKQFEQYLYQDLHIKLVLVPRAVPGITWGIRWWVL